ncbi:PTS lactose/cellobiose transporter subunit IIA [Brassicibacter mesophilus]|uniref:PTS lactose/cellobiose transporter subunit IIA n=1 Tax=Brassicibacter mesophilus TaxID=745119 RepID=UPI003D1B640B
MDFEMVIINIINHSGEARSLSMDGIRYAKNNDIEKARKCIEEANGKLSLAHKSQTTLIHEEAQGNKQELSLLLVHAQDHLMNAITIRDLANEFIDIYSKMTE